MSVNNEGLAYVFSNSGGTWSQTAILSSNSSLGSGSYGYSISADSSTLVIGAKDDGPNDCGQAYVYSVSSSPQLVTIVTPTGTPSNGEFGVDVALEGSNLFVGASSSGYAYLFEYVSAGGVGWSQTAILQPSVSSIASDFGQSVALDDVDGYLVVGAPGGEH